jgi:hypothetical protein
MLNKSNKKADSFSEPAFKKLFKFDYFIKSSSLSTILAEPIITGTR